MGEAMTDEMIDLGRRAVACKGWRWMPGMLTDDGQRVLHADGGSMFAGVGSGHDADGYGPFESRNMLPDFRDPATLGCLLALVREAWGLGLGLTEAAALVAALEAAPC